MRTWSDHPFPDDVPLSSVELAGENLGGGGQAHTVDRLADRPGWVAKLYKSPMAPAEAATLRRLVALPRSMTQADLGTLDRSAAWPVSRITDGDRTVGVVMAEAPSRFYVPFNLRGGRRSEPRELQLDHLVKDAAYLKAIGVHPPARQRRLEIACRFLELGAVLERHDVVYGDWSYRNALWDQDSDSVYLLDMDSCGIGTRSWIASPDWSDPAFPEGTPLTVPTDRYRMALLALRCITGARGEPLESLSRLERDWPASDTFPALLRQALDRGDLRNRPRTATLLKALRSPGGTGAQADVAPGSNVTGFRQVRHRPAAKTSGATTSGAKATGGTASGGTARTAEPHTRGPAPQPAATAAPGPGSHPSPAGNGKGAAQFIGCCVALALLALFVVLLVLWA
ncbi:hypothetical protein ACFWPQ_26200 [Streptomyces sp. NPDC058464]|uniref:hypothetical protein n=1 Tax=Streptomyces sp. NPDC058464 TaxID=3346511 RepID=UPI00364A1748